MVDEVVSLRTQCERSRLDIQLIPLVDYKSPEEDVRAVLKALQGRLRASRHVAVFEEGLLELSSALGDMFDGSWTMFGDFKPDLRDLRNVLNVRVSRLRSARRFRAPS